MNTPEFPPGALILDLGGWFKPLAAATHVVDLMPYETRRGRLTLEPLPGERFARADWFQADFLAPDLRLPFPDRMFDQVYCGHTLEDLGDPLPLLREIRRVARAGCITGPSRLAEQTRGVRDRRSSQPGYPHHHWIIDPVSGGLRFCAKEDSLAPGDGSVLLPLSHYGRRVAREGNGITFFTFRWERAFDVEFIRGEPATRLAREFLARERVTRLDRALDPWIRRGRRFKHRLAHRRQAATSDWWHGMLKLSRPYSAIPLP